ncbi:dihydrofolate reductase family protein [Fulvivirgaceae bacterium PWU4]|uniref:Dihydrofolate reductase family protein n=1 Tax=Chryseosolibacter histidini TaxID=2782349 RepID=A0AAP2DHA9_9BACT|nr:dihydrofolate reductase family protein [Chryseosolibacter histidini]MBT1695383.1 dihydrofolate reductase family protein [Chryseosolibacter histidini]
MGRIMSLINTTPDGFVDAQYTIADSEFYEFTLGLFSYSRAIAFGRNRFELFQNRWPLILEKEGVPESQAKMAKTMNDIHKVVFSSTLKSTAWNNSTIVREIDLKDINSYKQEGSGGLLTVGSPGLVAALAGMNLIDDYYFFIHPFIAGAGKDGMRLFGNLNLPEKRLLSYVNSNHLKSGVHIIHYRSDTPAQV